MSHTTHLLASPGDLPSSPSLPYHSTLKLVMVAYWLGIYLSDYLVVLEVGKVVEVVMMVATYPERWG